MRQTAQPQNDPNSEAHQLRIREQDCWLPDAPAQLVVTQWVIQTFVPRCPYCGGSHWHGGSKLEQGDPRSAFSGYSISAHCGKGTYILRPLEVPAVFGNGAFRHPQARAAMDRLQQMGIPTQLISVRPVVGFLCILLLAENLPDHDWWVVDYFPLRASDDSDLLKVVRAIQCEGYGMRVQVKAHLSYAVFSPGGEDDPRSIAAMQRLREHGLPTSYQIIANRDPELIWWADGGRPPRRSRK